MIFSIKYTNTWACGYLVKKQKQDLSTRFTPIAFTKTNNVWLTKHPRQKNLNAKSKELRTSIQHYLRNDQPKNKNKNS